MNEASIRECINYFSEKGRRFHYGISTNGIPINDDFLEFLNLHRAALQISFDGYAQEKQRMQPTIRYISQMIERIKSYPEIILSINSVFTKPHVSELSKSIIKMIELEIPEIEFCLDILGNWDEESLDIYRYELGKVASYLKANNDGSSRIPVSLFKRKKADRMFCCNQGENSLTIDTDGNIWGCYRFCDYFKLNRGGQDSRAFNFGNILNLDNIIEWIDQNGIEINRSFRTDRYMTSDHQYCFKCEYNRSCRICPANSVLSTSSFWVVPEWQCKVNQLNHDLCHSFHRDH